MSMLCSICLSLNNFVYPINPSLSQILLEIFEIEVDDEDSVCDTCRKYVEQISEFKVRAKHAVLEAKVIRAELETRMVRSESVESSDSDDCLIVEDSIAMKEENDFVDIGQGSVGILKREHSVDPQSSSSSLDYLMHSDDSSQTSVCGSKRRGRPRKPVEAFLDPTAIAKLDPEDQKYRVYRNRNNEASRRARQRRVEREAMLQGKLEGYEKRYAELTEQEEHLRGKCEKWRNALREIAQQEKKNKF